MTPPNLETSTEAGDLVIRRVVVGPLHTNCWILTDPASGAAIIVDPGDDPQRIIEACHDLTPTAIILTHQHWDHVLALPDLAEHYGIEVFAHAADNLVWPHELAFLHEHGHFDAGTETANLKNSNYPFGAPKSRPLWDGATTSIRHLDVIAVGDLQIQIRHTPGHTPGGVSLISQQHVFTGDTLFPGGPGLTGWPLSDFEVIIDSIQSQLFTLPETAKVHPGHGPSTTIGEEKPSIGVWIERGW